MASFRKSAAGPGGAGRFGGAGPLVGTPFSQAQILHLMKTEFARARRYGFPVCCMLIQVDRLEGLVDLHGAALREAVREQLGKLVREKTRGSDHLGLATEDRYLLVMPHTGGRQGLSAAERLRDGFKNLEFRVGRNELGLQLSIGVASCEDQSTLFFDTMLTQAEAALEFSATRGGDRCSLFGKDQIRSVEEEIETGAEAADPAAMGLLGSFGPRSLRRTDRRGDS